MVSGTYCPVSIAIQVSIDSQAVSRLQFVNQFPLEQVQTQQSYRNLLTREPAPNNVRLASFLQTLRQCRADNEFDDATLD